MPFLYSFAPDPPCKKRQPQKQQTSAGVRCLCCLKLQWVKGMELQWSGWKKEVSLLCVNTFYLTGLLFFSSPYIKWLPVYPVPAVFKHWGLADEARWRLMRKLWSRTPDLFTSKPLAPPSATSTQGIQYPLLSVTDNSASGDPAQHVATARERMNLFLCYCVTYFWEKIRARRHDIGICHAHIAGLNKRREIGEMNLNESLWGAAWNQNAAGLE